MTLSFTVVTTSADRAAWRVIIKHAPAKSEADAREIIKAWIAQGAKWGSDPIDPYRVSTDKRAGYDWWSLQPIKRPATPKIAPQTYSQPEIVLTSRQMRDTFIVLEVLLPLTTVFYGMLIWWRRR